MQEPGVRGWSSAASPTGEIRAAIRAAAELSAQQPSREGGPLPQARDASGSIARECFFNPEVAEGAE